MSNNKSIVFDVVGTLVSYDRLFVAIDSRLGDRLRAQGIQPKLLGCCWLETAEREYTYLSLNGRYVVFFEIFEALFFRVLMYAGISQPRTFAMPEDVQYIIGEWRKLDLRPGAAECISKLREAGFTVYCFTTAELSRVQGYFDRGGVEMPAEHLISCDTAGLAKPIPEAYKQIWGKFSSSSVKPWFAAAHMWDVSAATKVGFRGAYATVLEGEALPEIFGELEIMAETLPEMAEKIIEAS
ncbi:haloacid dehalogenase-like hydrolase [Truncatella angustata]|uniref:Haloacid dehalogenase-like hydrolase n=1 Tax=Truncatella angustata TaxID=152316 RepID=A0A9P8RJZ6_9PEZI|nr:haloacid dehalogenase-like hydrolase [Truncatella angustata]KAH6640095.1 haloacid dehalogenase-like hydrolase [Truncatella angustata]